MFNKRLKIFIIIITLPLLVYIARLVEMQIVSRQYYQERIDELKRGRSQQLKTIRGSIFDRNGVILAADEPKFQLCINYKLCSFLDKRVTHRITEEEKKEKVEELKEIIQKCAQFKAVDPNEIEAEITRINNSIWVRRQFQAWRTSFPNSKILREASKIESIPQSKAMADFAEKEPDPKRRQSLANKVDILEMHQNWPLVDLQNLEDVFAAQLAFLGVDGVPIIPRAVRVYPQGSAASQTIGWVSKPQEKDKKLFENKFLANYLEEDISGREGTEYVAESRLRGSRGKLVYDIDRKLVSRTPTRFGRDLHMTIDIELQKQIESILTDPTQNEYSHNPSAAVLIDVNNADILALASTPVYNLNRARYDFDDLQKDPNNPMLNRAIKEHYPPGSVIKPIILLIGLEEGKISPGNVIGCTGHKAPKYWPSCWNKSGHDSQWQNMARNAIKGSCNIYFSRLANRIDSVVLREWLLKFGFGQRYDLHPRPDPNTDSNIKSRRFKQVPGTISSERVTDKIAPSARRMFGIGQGNLRVTPLQVANVMATIARGGLHIRPRLFLPDANAPDTVRKWTDLKISEQNLAVLHDGMYAVVNERNGTAYSKAFEHSGFDEQGVTVYGKTGSTQGIELAWFGGFAKDDSGRCIAIALVVEGGQHGSSDAAPLARDIIQFCIKLGYLGNPVPLIE